MALDPITTALEIGGKVIDRLWPNPAEAAAAKLELLKMQQTGELALLAADTDIAKGQLQVNAVEASSTRLFVAGWRPLIGWVCGGAFAWNWIGLPVATFALTATGHPIALEPASMSEMMPVLLGMLGLGGLRTFEKVKGAA